MYCSLEKQQKDRLKIHNYKQAVVNEGQACFSLFNTPSGQSRQVGFDACIRTSRPEPQNWHQTKKTDILKSTFSRERETQ